MARVREDIQVANDLRGRRRRQRERRRQRTNTNSRRGRNNTYRSNVRAESSRNQRRNNGVNNPRHRVSLMSMLDETLYRYCEAVVDPFGNAAIGATLPDRFQELVMPLLDRLELDISPSDFNTPGSAGQWDEQNSLAQLTGFFLWFQPRCIAAGTLVRDTYDGGGSFQKYNALPISGELDNFDATAQMNQYVLCITGQFNFSGNPTWGFYESDGVDPVGSGIINPFHIEIGYTRFQSIFDNCDKLRILGAGLKAWSEQAPINTGGYSVGGWITFEDIVTALQCAEDGTTGTLIAENPGAVAAIIPSIRYPSRNPGVKGSTVRYSPVQAVQQQESEYARLPQRLWNSDSSTNAPWKPSDIVANNQADLAIGDVIIPGTFVPCINWVFNTSDTGAANTVYTVKIMSVVHSEGTPTGSSPFLANKSQIDPMVDHVKGMLENPEEFPPAVSGHSFKSFLTKATHIVGKVAKFASKTAKIAELISQTMGQVGGMAGL